MARPTDVSPNPFVGYIAQTAPGEAIPTPLAGDEDTLSDAPYSPSILPHPRDVAQGFLDTLPHQNESMIARTVDAAVRRTQLDVPHWHILHDRLRTTHGWKHQVDALYEGSFAAPAAGASTLVTIPPINPLLPGNPGQVLVYPFINLVSVGSQGTALTGVWSVDVLVNGQTIPCGVYAGLVAGTVRPEEMGSIPFPGNIDAGGVLAQLRLSILAGATVTSVTFYAQASISFVYRFIDDLPAVRRHGAGESVIEE